MFLPIVTGPLQNTKRRFLKQKQLFGLILHDDGSLAQIWLVLEYKDLQYPKMDTLFCVSYQPKVPVQLHTI